MSSTRLPAEHHGELRSPWPGQQLLKTRLTARPCVIKPAVITSCAVWAQVTICLSTSVMCRANGCIAQAGDMRSTAAAVTSGDLLELIIAVCVATAW